MTPSAHTFQKCARLTKKEEFDAVYSFAQCKRTNAFSIHAMPNHIDQHRLGLSVPKRVGTAVVRNRVKRLVREAFRLVHESLPSSYDIVVTFHKRPEQGQKEFEHFFQRVIDEFELKCKT
ncbi:MAG: ribonuclease P protein component [Phycisphaerales bacterium]|jgi:ribonuclease P protein component|nr:ribonuclease P protein component [Phycisphaerales bacterium]